jgi:hypothetical protein
MQYYKVHYGTSEKIYFLYSSVDGSKGDTRLDDGVWRLSALLKQLTRGGTKGATETFQEMTASLER